MAASRHTYIHTTSANAVTLVRGPLRLVPISGGVHHFTHPVHPQTYFLVRLFHNVSCALLVLLFESLGESIPLFQVTLALLLRPAGRNNVSL